MSTTTMPTQATVALIALDEIERGYVLRVLQRCDGNRTAAAKILHIDRKTLARKLRKWGLDMVM